MNTPNNSGAIIALAASIREQTNTYILNALSRHGVGDILPAHGAVLHALFESGPLKMNELAERIKRKKNTVTGLISTLESRGYCRREADPQDARSQIVLLTEKGEAMRRIQEEISVDLLRVVWGDVGEAEKAACTQTLQKVLRNLQKNESNNC